MTTLHKVIAGIVGAWLVVLSVVGLSHKTSQPVQTAKLGAQVQNEPFWFNQGAQFGPNGVSLNYGPVLVMGSGSNQVSWLNNTGKTVYVNTGTTDALLVSGNTSATTASSTMNLWIGTSTTATVTDSATNPIFGSVIDKTSIATSTALGSIFDGIVNSAFAGSKEQGTVSVANGQYLVAVIEAAAGLGSCNGSTCETATSTNRGYNLNIVFRYWNL